MIDKGISVIKEANELQNQMVYHIISQCLILMAKKNFADCFAHGPMKLEALAKHLGFHPKAAERLFRLLETLNLVKLTSDHIVEATALTSHIKEVYSEHYFGSFLAFNYFQKSLESNKECWSEAFNQSFYDYLKGHPDKLKNFQIYLQNTAESWLSFVPEVFDFSKYETIVDVGGGQGQLLAKIIESTKKANKAHEIKGILLEKEEIMPAASHYLMSKNLRKYIQLVEGDFLNQDLPEGDIYILCRVLLNWSDEDGVNIIRNCLKKVSSHRKLIIIDFVIPPKTHEHYQRAILHDLNLLGVFGGSIRSLRQWKTLVSEATHRKAHYKIIDEHISPVLNVPMVMVEL